MGRITSLTVAKDDRAPSVFGTTLALMTRALRVESRRIEAHLARLFFAGLILLAIGVTFLDPRLIGAPGLAVFWWILWINGSLITLAAISYFPTAITEEKEEETLGLLKMTGMSPLALLLGKSTSRLIGACLALCVQFPFVQLAVTLGGVLPGQIVAAFVALLAYMFGIANMGLYVSVRCRTSRESTRVMVLLLGLYLIGVPLADAIVDQLWSDHVLATPTVHALKGPLLGLYRTSIFKEISLITETGFAGSPLRSPQVWTCLAIGLLFFILAWARFEHLTQREHFPCSWSRGSKEPAPERGRFLAGRFGIFTAPFASLKTRVDRPTRTPNRAWQNPFVWKDFYFITGGVRWAFAKFLFYGLFLYLLLQSTIRWGGWDYFVGWSWVVMVLALVIEASICVSRLFSQEAREQTLPLLKMLPRSWWLTCWSKVGGCLIGLTPILCCFAYAGLQIHDYYRNDPNMKRFLFEPMLWTLILMIIVGLHLAAYFSLLIKYGAIPISLVIVCMAFGGLQYWLQFRSPSAPDAWRRMFASCLTLASLPVTLMLPSWIGGSVPSRLRRSAIARVGYTAGVTLLAFRISAFAAPYCHPSFRDHMMPQPYVEVFTVANWMTVPIMLAIQMLIALRLRKLSTQ